ncbi:MAG TPA: hypothetical protein TECP_00389 [Hyphomicrobiaceae bacterium MAG_BT-2024]
MIKLMLLCNLFGLSITLIKIINKPCRNQRICSKAQDESF